MQNEIKKCQNCKNEFTIEPEDFAFYEKIKVPPPTFCPECRMIDRFNNLSESTFYKDKCDNCGKEIVSLFSPLTLYKVFCNSCWWGDTWDGTEYGKEYDFSKPFFEQLHELRKVVPCQATNVRNSENCNYCNGVDRCKNCVLTTSGMQSINCYFSQTILFSKDSLDSRFLINGEKAYENLNSSGAYNTKYIYFSTQNLDCSFLFNCRGCSDCFGCINLRNKKYCIFNKQYTKDEYKKEIKKWDLGSYKILEKAKEIFWDLYYKTPRKYALITNSFNVSGDDIQNTKNCKMCFSSTHGVENCKYIFQCGLLVKDSYDSSLGGDNSELLYQSTGSTNCQKILFTRASTNTRDTEYSENLYNCSSCFGCAKLRDKKYCILNKQYSKEEYEKLLPKIKEHMNNMPYINKNGIIYKYGDYFPKEHSMWAYNESWAHLFFPITKEEAIQKGYIWNNPPERDYKITKKWEDLPDHIDEVSDSIVNEVISCKHSKWIDNENGNSECNEQCTTAFRILPNELALYRSLKISLPRYCPNCRKYQSVSRISIPKLWHRKCMCDGAKSKGGLYQNVSKHFHGDGPCQNEFETAISPERKEIVYCEKCYQNEFI